MIMSQLLPTDSSSALDNHYLHGIGYREQELQQASGARFRSKKPEGIPWASFAGGTNIYIKGFGYSEHAQSNQVWLKSIDLKDQNILAPTLTEDDAFGSSPKTGYLQYRLPSVANLLAIPARYLDAYLSMTFILTIRGNDGLNDMQTLACKSLKTCTIKVYRSYTPVVHYINPPVVYFEQETEIFFNPKSIQNLIKDLPSDEKKFINAKISGNQIDFEFNVDSDTGYWAWNRYNRARGIVGDQPPTSNHTLTMLWETGFADNSEYENLHCGYDNKTCYQVKTIPVIFQAS